MRNTWSLFRSLLGVVGGGIILAACGGGSTQADSSHLEVSESQAGPTPNISFVSLTGNSLDGLISVDYTVQVKPGGVSKPVHVSNDRIYLQRRGYLSEGSTALRLPVFGLYAGRTNVVELTANFQDGSTWTAKVGLTTEALTGASAVYATPSVVRARAASEALGFDFFYVKAGIGAPVVIDTDAELRWTGVAVPSALSTRFIQDSFLVGDQDAPLMRRVYLDGSVEELPIAQNALLTAFHHDLSLGKTGYLAEFNAVKNGVNIVESILAEIDPKGVVLKTWDMGDIIGKYMAANGDSPASFVRDGFDWFHMNSAIYDARDDSLIISSREDFVVKIDYASGEIQWILGDPTKYWATFPSLRRKALTLADGGWYPIGQHALSLSGTGELMLFNNGFWSTQQPAGAPAGDNRTSSAVSSYAIDSTNMRAVETSRYDNAQSILSIVCSSAYEAGSGSLLISYAMAEGGTTARIVAVDADRRVLMDLSYPANGCQTSWNAQPIAFEAMVLR